MTASKILLLEKGISLNPLSPPYFEIKIPDKSPLEVFLFLITGNMENVDLEKDKLRHALSLENKKVSREYVINFYGKKDPRTLFLKNKDLPLNSFAFTLSNGKVQKEIIEKNDDLIEELIFLSTKKQGGDLNIYSFLAEYYQISMKIYNDEKMVGVPDKEIFSFISLHVPKKCFMFLINKEMTEISPLAKQALDGLISIIV